MSRVTTWEQATWVASKKDMETMSTDQRWAYMTGIMRALKYASEYYSGIECGKCEEVWPSDFLRTDADHDNYCPKCWQEAKKDDWE